jgi:hypothetical protein
MNDDTDKEVEGIMKSGEARSTNNYKKFVYLLVFILNILEEYIQPENVEYTKYLLDILVMEQKIPLCSLYSHLKKILVHPYKNLLQISSIILHHEPDESEEDYIRKVLSTLLCVDETMISWFLIDSFRRNTAFVSLLNKFIEKKNTFILLDLQLYVTTSYTLGHSEDENTKVRRGTELIRELYFDN